MTLAQSVAGEHDPDCSGCPSCREDFAALLDETPQQASRRLTAHTETMMRALTHGSLRTADTFVFRVSQPRPDVRRTLSEWCDHFGHRLRGYGSVQVGAPPDPYGTTTAKARCPFDDPHYQPHGAAPDGYALALAKEKNR